MTDSPYEWRVHVATSSNDCLFCGAVVSVDLWDDHVHWHETLDLQATAVMRRALLEIEEEMS